MSVRPGFSEAIRFWLKLGCIGFGGPTGQIAIMHTELVDRKRWIGEKQFLHALNFCMLLPGPEATQLATYCGWLLHGIRGGVIAGVLFVLPSAVLLWGLSWSYAEFGSVPWVAAIFAGLKAAVTAIVAGAVIKIGQRVLKTPTMWTLAGAAFVAIFFLRVPFPLIIGAAAAVGLMLPKVSNSGPSSGETDVVTTPGPARTWRATVTIAVVSLLLWWTPVLIAGAIQGWEGVLFREGLFFSKAALVTFGGAYAVLPYVGQQAVETYRWLTPEQMLDGLALAETTPGPLIMVVQFVGFLGGWNQPGALSPIAMATLGAAITTWTTFVPCFLWILVGAPYVERLRGIARLNTALTAVTAAVVGVVLNLAVWFAGHVFLVGDRVQWFSVVLATAAFIAIWRFKVGIVALVFASGAIGLAWHLAAPSRWEIFAR